MELDIGKTPSGTTASTSPSVEQSKEELAKLEERRQKAILRKREERAERKQAKQAANSPDSATLTGIEFGPLAVELASLVPSILPSYFEQTPPTKEETKLIAQGLEMGAAQHGERLAKHAPVIVLMAGLGFFLLRRMKKRPPKVRTMQPAQSAGDIVTQPEVVRPDLWPKNIKLPEEAT